MARSVNEEEFTSRRNEILDVAQQLIYTIGFETMTIQDILDRLQISKGAFYHYFRSKQELLEALLDRISRMLVKQMEPVIFDPDLPAIEKLNMFYSQTGQWKTDRRDLLIPLMRGWYVDENALVREKLRRMSQQVVVPILTHIICQGVSEGVMDTRFPEQVADVVLAIIYNIGESTAALALAAANGQTGNLEQARRLTDMYANTIERVLGMAPGSMHLMNEQVMITWFG